MLQIEVVCGVEVGWGGGFSHLLQTLDVLLVTVNNEESSSVKLTAVFSEKSIAHCQSMYQSLV